jgi:hypothetical protein
MSVLIKKVLLGSVLGGAIALTTTYILFYILGVFFPCVDDEFCIFIKNIFVIFFGSLFSLFVAQILVHKIIY